MQLSSPLPLVFLLVAACVVPQTKYDALARTLAETKAASDAELTDLRKQLANAETAGQERDSKVSELTTARHNLQASLDEATAIHQQLRGELERLGKDVDKVLKERGLGLGNPMAIRRERNVAASTKWVPALRNIGEVSLFRRARARHILNGVGREGA